MVLLLSQKAKKRGNENGVYVIRTSFLKSTSKKIRVRSAFVL